MVWSIMVVTISKKLICSHRSLHSPEWCCLIHLMLDLPPFIDHMLRTLCSFLTIDSCHFLPIGFFIPFLAFEDLYICDFFIHRYIKQWETYFLHVFFVHFHFILFFFYICNFFQDECLINMFLSFSGCLINVVLYTNDFVLNFILLKRFLGC